MIKRAMAMLCVAPGPNLTGVTPALIDLGRARTVFNLN